MIENGYNNLITVDAEGTIVTGHTRYKAMIEMSPEERTQAKIGKTIEVIDLSHLTAEQIKRYRIADNKAGEKSLWDYDLLIPELREINETDSMQIYFHDLDLKTALAPPVYGDAIGADDDQDVEDADSRIKDSFSGMAEKQDKSVRELICPHCAKTFFVDRKEFED